MLAYTHVELNDFETLAKTFIIPARQNQFNQENIFNNAPVRWNAVAIRTKPALNGSHTENSYPYQHVFLRQIGTFRGGQPIVDFVAANNCHQYDERMNATGFQDKIPPTAVDNFKDHCKLVFEIFSMQEAIANCHYQERFAEQPIL